MDERRLLLRQSHQRDYNDATRYDTYLAIAVGVLLLGYIANRILRRRAARAAEPS